MLRSGHSKRISEKENVGELNTAKKPKSVYSTAKRTPAPRTPLTRTPLKGWALNTTPVPPQTVQKRTLADELAEVEEEGGFKVPLSTPLRALAETPELKAGRKQRETPAPTFDQGHAPEESKTISEEKHAVDVRELTMCIDDLKTTVSMQEDTIKQAQAQIKQLGEEKSTLVQQVEALTLQHTEEKNALALNLAETAAKLAEATVWQTRAEELQAELESAIVRMEQLRTEKDEAQARVNSLMASVDEKDAKIAQYETKGDRTVELKDQIAVLGAQVEELNGLISAHNAERVEFEARFANSTEQIGQLEIKCQHTKAELEAEQGKCAQLGQGFEAAKEEIAKLELLVGVSETKIEQSTRQKAELEASVTAMEAQIAELVQSTRQMEHLTEQNGLLTQQLQSAETVHNGEMQERASQIKQLEEKLRDLQAQRLDDLKLSEQRNRERDLPTVPTFDEPATPAKRLDRRMSFVPGVNPRLPAPTPLQTPRVGPRESTQSTKESLEFARQLASTNQARVKALEKENEGLKKKIQEHEVYRQSFTNKEIELAKVEFQDNANKEALKNLKLEVAKIQGEKENLRKTISTHEKELEKLRIDYKHEKDKSRQSVKDAGETELVKDALQKEIKIIQKKLESIQKENESLKGIDAKRRELSLTLAQIEKKLSDSQASCQKAHKESQDLQTKLTNTIEDFNKRQVEFEKSIIDAGSVQKKLESQLHAMAVEMTELNGKYSTANGEIAQMKKQKEELDHKLETANERNNKLSQKHKDSKQEIEKEREKYAHLNLLLVGAKDEITAFALKCQQLQNDQKRDIAEKDRFSEALKETQTQLATTNTSLAETKEEVNALKPQLSSLQQQHEATVTELHSTRVRFNECFQNFQQSQNELQNAKSVLDQVRQEYSLELDTSNKEFKSLQAEHESTTAELISARRQLEELGVIATRLNEELASTVAEFKAETLERERCQTLAEALKEKVSATEGHLRTEQEKNLATEGHLRTEQEKCQQLGKDVARLTKEIEGKASELQQMQVVSAEQAQAITKFSNQLQVKGEELSAKEQKLSELISAKNELDKELAVTKQALTTTEQKCQELKASLDNISGECRSLLGQLKHQVAATEAKAAHIAELEGKHEEAKRDWHVTKARLEGDLVVSQEGVARLTQELDTKVSELKKAQAVHLEQEKGIFKLSHQLQVKGDEISAKEHKISELTSSKTHLEEELTITSQALAEVEQKCQDTKSALETTVAQLKTLQEAHRTLSTQFKQQVATTEAKVANIAELEAALQKANEEWTSTKAEQSGEIARQRQALVDADQKHQELSLALCTSKAANTEQEKAIFKLSHNLQVKSDELAAKDTKLTELLSTKTHLEEELTITSQALSEAEARGEDLKAGLDASSAQLKSAQEANRNLMAQLKQHGASLEAKGAQLTELEGKYEEAQQHWESCKTTLEGELAGARQTGLRLTKELEAKSAEVQQAQTAHAEQDKSIFKLSHQLQVKSEALSTSEQKLSETASGKALVEEELTIANEALADAEQKCKDLRSSLDNTLAQLKTLQETHRGLTAQFKQQVVTCDAKSTQIVQLEAAFENAKQEWGSVKSQLNGDLTDCRAALNGSEQKCQELQNSLISAKTQCSEQEKAIFKLTHQMQVKGDELATREKKMSELMSTKTLLEEELTVTTQALNEAEQRAKEMQSARDTLSGQLKSLQEAHRALTSQFKQQLAANEQKSVEWQTKLEEAQRDWMAAKTQLEEQLEIKDQSLATSEQKYQLLQNSSGSQLRTLKEANRELKATLEKKTARLSELESNWAEQERRMKIEIEALRDSKEASEKANENAARQISGLEKESKDLKKNLDKTVRDRDALRAKLTTELESVKKELAITAQQLGGTEEALRSSKAEVEKLNQSVRDLTEESQRRSDTIAAMKTEHESKAKTRAADLAKERGARAKVESERDVLNEEVARLTDALEKATDREKQSKKAAAKADGEISRLTDLVKISNRQMQLQGDTDVEPRRASLANTRLNSKRLASSAAKLRPSKEEYEAE